MCILSDHAVNILFDFLILRNQGVSQNPVFDSPRDIISLYQWLHFKEWKWQQLINLLQARELHGGGKPQMERIRDLIKARC